MAFFSAHRLCLNCRPRKVSKKRKKMGINYKCNKCSRIWWYE